MSNLVPPPDLSRRWVFWATLIGIIICFVVIDLSFASSRIHRYSSVIKYYWLPLNVGAILAQSGLLAIYAVLGPGRIWRRQSVAVLLGFGSILAWLLGFSLDDVGFPGYPMNDPETQAAILVLPALFCVGCVPLWILRSFFRWRIESPKSDKAVDNAPQLSIAGMLSATFVAALTLALIRLGAYLSPLDEPVWWQCIGIAVAFTAGICLFTLPFSTWLILYSRGLVIGTSLAVVWLSIVGLVLFLYVEGGWPRSDARLMEILLCASFICFLLGPLIVCRRFHYRLVVGKQQPQMYAAASQSRI
ncbi:MAG: hypothetical protein ACR2FY_04325 [Pirellulaceae bacterium]